MILYLNDNYLGLGFRICWKMQVPSSYGFYLCFDPLVIIPPISSFYDESLYKIPYTLRKQRIPTLLLLQNTLDYRFFPHKLPQPNRLRTY